MHPLGGGPLPRTGSPTHWVHRFPKVPPKGLDNNHGQQSAHHPRALCPLPKPCHMLPRCGRANSTSPLVPKQPAPPPWCAPPPRVHTRRGPSLGIAHLRCCHGKSYSGPLQIASTDARALHCNGLHVCVDERGIRLSIYLVTFAPLIPPEDLKVLVKKRISKICLPSNVSREYDSIQFCLTPGESGTFGHYLVVGFYTLSGAHMSMTDVLLAQPDIIQENHVLVSLPDMNLHSWYHRPLILCRIPRTNAQKCISRTISRRDTALRYGLARNLKSCGGLPLASHRNPQTTPLRNIRTGMRAPPSQWRWISSLTMMECDTPGLRAGRRV